jgi:hypothetical protein
MWGFFEEDGRGWAIDDLEAMLKYQLEDGEKPQPVHEYAKTPTEYSMMFEFISAIEDSNLKKETILQMIYFMARCISSFDRDLEDDIDEFGKNHRDYKKIEALYERYHQYDD